MSVDMVQKQQVLDTTATYFFSKRQDEINNTLVSLIESNMGHGGSHLGFYYGGALYTNFAPKYTRGKPIFGINKELHEQARLYVQAVENLNCDRKTLNQLFLVVARLCDTYQDIRDTLPDSLVEYSPHLMSLTRQNPEGYAFHLQNPNDSRFERLRAISSFYKANELLGI